MSNETLAADNTALQVTEAKLIDWSACSSGKNWFLEKFPQGGMFGDVYQALRDDRRYDDGNWLVEKMFSQLDAKTKTEQLVSISGADKAKIERQVKECGGKEEESATTGNWANAATTGEHSVSAALGIQGNAKAGIGGAIVLCHRNDSGELIHIRASKVGENGIKADTWYALDADGEFVEVQP